MNANVRCLAAVTLLLALLPPLGAAPAGAAAGGLKVVRGAMTDADVNGLGWEGIAGVAGGWVRTGDVLTVLVKDLDLQGVTLVTGEALSPVDANGEPITIGTTWYWKAPLSVDPGAGPQTVRVAGSTVPVEYVQAFNYFALWDAVHVNSTVTADFYTGGAQAANTATVTVAGTDSITVTLRETASSSGIFRGEVRIGLVTNDVTGEVQAVHGTVVTVTYADTAPVGAVSASVGVDNLPPVVSGARPPAGARVGTTTLALTVDVTDAGSGLAAVGGVRLLVKGGAAGEATPDGEFTEASSAVSAAIAGGVRLSYGVPAGVFGPGDNAWRVKVMDAVGNEAGASFPLIVDGAGLTAESGETGRWLKGDGGIGSNSKSSLAVLFSRAVDPASVQPADFAVAGNTVTGVAVGPAADQGADSPLPNVARDSVVFLSLRAPLGAGDRPEVRVVSAVSGVAGDVIDLGAVVAPPVSDRIAATWRADISPGPAGVSVIVRSDEAMSAVGARLLGPDGEYETLALGPSLTEANTWTAAAVSAGKAAGSWTLQVWGLDASGNDSGTAAAPMDVAVAVTIALTPGWNLVSVPRPLMSMAVGDVLNGATGAGRVYTYDGTTGSWSAAQSVGGRWEGVPGLALLDQFALGRGYLVESASAVILVLPGRPIEPLEAPAAYPLAAGWNLVGYTNLRLAAVSVDEYLASLGSQWMRMLKFSQGAYTAIVRQLPPAATGETMEIGKGFWLFMAQAGELAPP